MKTTAMETTAVLERSNHLIDAVIREVEEDLSRQTVPADSKPVNAAYRHCVH